MGDCATPTDSSEAYDLGAHIASIFIILGVSTLGTLFPIVAKTFPSIISIPPYTFQLLKTFGTGIILTTGYVHMLSPAAQALSDTNECLPQWWRESYSAWAGAFALLSTLMVQGVQTCVGCYFEEGKHGDDDDDDVDDDCGEEGEGYDTRASSSADVERAQLIVAPAAAKQQNFTRHLKAHTYANKDCCAHPSFEKSKSGGSRTTTSQITTYILEAGISTHSILIGLTLGTTTGKSFTSLLIAISFHQFFEGFAVASTALDAGFQGKFKPLLMAGIYALATPMGIVLGIAIRLLTSDQGGDQGNAVLIVGIMDAICAGILIYDCLVNLITTQITRSASFKRQSKLHKIGVFVALWSGSAIMALLGKWI